MVEVKRGVPFFVLVEECFGDDKGHPSKSSRIFYMSLLAACC